MGAYEVVFSDLLSELTRSVNILVERGYEPIGSVVLCDTSNADSMLHHTYARTTKTNGGDIIFMQTMYKKPTLMALV